MSDADLENALNPLIDAGQLAGAVMLKFEENESEVTCVGYHDIESNRPTMRDTIYRIASMTKPMTSVLALMLLEEGRISLNQSIATVAPEFAEMSVLLFEDGPLGETTPATRQITFLDLLTHRSGLTYGDFHLGPISNAYADQLGGDIDSNIAPENWVAALAELPLIDQPGTNFHYGKSTDLLGLLIERIERAPLNEIFRHRLFKPLEMLDTDFVIDPSKHDRCAGLHGFDENGYLTTLANAPGDHTLPERPKSMQFYSGGQGLWSTVDDYLRFARIFIEQGASNGVQILRPDTVNLMMTNHLTQAQRSSAKLLGQSIFAKGHGFGLGTAVVLEPEFADPLRCGGGTGSVGWPGAYGSWWQADPNDGTIRIFLTHNLVSLDQLMNGVGLGAWEAIGNFQAS